MSGALQLGVSDDEQVDAKKKTRRQIFLDAMDATIPWDDCSALIRPGYHQPSTTGGRSPFPLDLMLRIHWLQQWITLSDPRMEEMPIDTPCFRRFAGIDTVSERIPDETTISKHPRQRMRHAEANENGGVVDDTPPETFRSALTADPCSTPSMGAS